MINNDKTHAAYPSLVYACCIFYFSITKKVNFFTYIKYIKSFTRNSAVRAKLLSPNVSVNFEVWFRKDMSKIKYDKYKKM